MTTLWKGNTLEAYFCLRAAKRLGADALLPFDSHPLPSSYLRRGDGEEARGLDLINATI